MAVISLRGDNDGIEHVACVCLLFNILFHFKYNV